jgi:hypothetical protein
MIFRGEQIGWHWGQSQGREERRILTFTRRERWESFQDNFCRSGPMRPRSPSQQIIRHSNFQKTEFKNFLNAPNSFSIEAMLWIARFETCHEGLVVIMTQDAFNHFTLRLETDVTQERTRGEEVRT